MMLIFGAGLAGLLAGRVFGKNHDVKIIERQEELPNNHTALLRFRTNNISKELGIPFRKVTVRKALVNQMEEVTDRVTIADMNAYSALVTDGVYERSIANLASGERYIAPNDFVIRLANGLNIEYAINASCHNTVSEPIISTLPMPELMKMLEYQNDLSFQSRTIWTINCYIRNCDVFQTLYLPHGGLREIAPYRASITGNKLTLEFNQEPIIDPGFYVIDILNTLKIPCGFEQVTVKRQPYGKLIPIDDVERKAFIVWATDNFNIYSLGRFATWRKELLLDDVLDDIHHISTFIQYRSTYERRKHYT